ncbi:MAG: hypothetical protein AAF708_04305 [Deinococcota bacterium]
MIEMESEDAVEQEMDRLEWESFIADIESRITDATYVTATKILP